jgi:putative ABC transport system permease protein
MVGAAAPRLGGSARVAVRGLARHRARSAATVGAVAAALAGPIALLTFTASHHLQELRDAPPSTTVTITRGDGTDDAQFEAVVTGAGRILGPTAWVLAAPAAATPTSSGLVDVVAQRPATVDPRLRPLVTALAAGRPVSFDVGRAGAARLSLPGGRTVAITDHVTVPHAGTTGAGSDPRALLADVAGRGILVPAGYGGLQADRTTVQVFRPSALDDASDRALHQLSGPDQGPTVAELRHGTGSGPGVSIITNYSDAGSQRAGVVQAIEASGLAVALAVTAIGLALHALDGRDERSILAAIGAPPRLRRRTRLVEALVLTTLAALLGAAIGWLPMAAALHAEGRQVREVAETYGATAGTRLPDSSVSFPALAIAALAATTIGLAVAGTWLVEGLSWLVRRRKPAEVVVTRD